MGLSMYDGGLLASARQRALLREAEAAGRSRLSRGRSPRERAAAALVALALRLAPSVGEAAATGQVAGATR